MKKMIIFLTASLMMIASGCTKSNGETVVEDEKHSTGDNMQTTSILHGCDDSILANGKDLLENNYVVKLFYISKDCELQICIKRGNPNGFNVRVIDENNISKYDLFVHFDVDPSIVDEEFGMPLEDVNYEVACCDLDSDNIKEIVFSASNSEWVKSYIYTIQSYEGEVKINLVHGIETDGSYIALEKVISEYSSLESRWQKVYADTLVELSGNFTNENLEFLIKDLDDDNYPELIVKDQFQMTVYKKEAYMEELGSYDFVTGTTRLVASDEKEYPGIFCYYVEGGLVHCEYIFVRINDMKIIELWNGELDELELDRGSIEEIAINKALINESKRVYGQESDLSFVKVNSDNIQNLQMYYTE